MSLELTQKRMKLALLLASLTTSAFFVAQGTTQIVASSLLDVAPAPEERPSRRSARPAATAALPTRDLVAMGTAILQRNIFDSETGPITWNEPPPAVAETEDEAGPVVIDPNAPPPPCDGQIRLVGSYVRPDAPEQSFAAIAASNGPTLLYTQGRRVEEREVVSISKERVILRPSSGSACSLSMFAPPTGATPTPPPVIAQAEAPPPAPSESGVDTAELDANITQVSDNNYAVNRSLVDRLLSNQAELMRSARVIPHEVDGHVVGVKIYGIRRSSLLGRLGIQNGDMLRTINGFNLSEPDSALEAYARLRTADHLSLSVERRGQPVTMDYQIR